MEFITFTDVILKTKKQHPENRHFFVNIMFLCVHFQDEGSENSIAMHSDESKPATITTKCFGHQLITENEAEA